MDRIIRTCSALALLLMPEAAWAARDAASPATLYVRARVADAARMPDAAVANYAAALTADPTSTVIAFRAYREAVEAGDFALALRAAQALERAGGTPPDASLLFYVAALHNRDWREARARLDAMAQEPGFGFLAPLLGDWLALVTRDPASPPREDERPNAYRAENDALLMLARGETDAGITAVKGMWTLDPYRAGSLRIAAAATVRGPRGAALIVADDAAAVRARTLIERGRKSVLAVDTPARGAAFLLARVSGDLTVERSGRSALTMARFAQFAAPDNPRILLNVAGALDAVKRHQAALDLADGLRGDAVYADDAASFVIDQLEALGRTDEAVAAAQALSGRSVNDAARVGDIELRRRNFEAAAIAYDAMLKQIGIDKAPWRALYAAANAHDNAGRWAVAKPLLERALLLAPEEPLILNELGFGLVVNGDDVTRGAALIAKAADQKPDDAAIIDSLGWAKFKTGQIDRAIVLLERAVFLDIGQPEIGEHLGDVYWAAGRRIDARYAWTAARLQAEGVALARLDAKIAGGLDARAE